MTAQPIGHCRYNCVAYLRVDFTKGKTSRITREIYPSFLVGTSGQETDICYRFTRLRVSLGMPLLSLEIVTLSQGVPTMCSAKVAGGEAKYLTWTKYSGACSQLCRHSPGVGNPSATRVVHGLFHLAQNL